MDRVTHERIGTIEALREVDGHAVRIDVYRKWLHVTFSEGTTDRADNGREFRIGNTVLRVDGAAPEYLVDAQQNRYKINAPL